MPEDRNRTAPRATALLEFDGQETEILEAWRTSRGTKLVLVFPGPRRILVAEDRELTRMEVEELRIALEGASGLTATEACFDAPDGRRWLAQAVGPVWAGSEGAEGLAGTLFTSIDGPFERFESRGSPLRPDRGSGVPVDADLAEIWRTGRDLADG